MQNDNNRKNVLVTGSSSGIGYELCKQFAFHNHNLILVSRDTQRLITFADELQKKFNISIKVISKDLTALTAANEIYDELNKESINVDILVNNAGFNVYGPFWETELLRELQMIQLNLISLTQLTKLVLPSMLKRRFGRIMNIGSTGSYVPGPLNAVYCATKAYVLSFSEAIAEELTGSGVTVTTLCPGATATDFARRANMDDTKLFQGRTMDAKNVAEIGYRALIEGRRTVIAGTGNKFLVYSTKLMPRSIVARMVKNMMSRT